MSPEKMDKIIAEIKRRESKELAHKLMNEFKERRKREDEYTTAAELRVEEYTTAAELRVEEYIAKNPNDIIKNGDIGDDYDRECYNCIGSISSRLGKSVRSDALWDKVFAHNKKVEADRVAKIKLEYGEKEAREKEAREKEAREKEAREKRDGEIIGVVFPILLWFVIAPVVWYCLSLIF